MVAGAARLHRAANEPNGARGATGARMPHTFAASHAGQRDDIAALLMLMQNDEHTHKHKKYRCSTTTPPLLAIFS